MKTRMMKNKLRYEELRERIPRKFAVSKERWFAMSLEEQLGNIGSEVGRTRKWQGKDETSFWGAATRALELFDLTQADLRWKSRRPELDRARESFADAVLGGGEYQSTLPDLEKYFMQFALLTQREVHHHTYE